MKCESLLCIYQCDDACVFPEEIVLDWRGSCNHYCPVDAGGQELRRDKERLLEDYEGTSFITAYKEKYGY